MDTKKYKLVLAYDIQDLEGNSQVPENSQNAFEVLLATNNLNDINFEVLHTSTWLVLQHLREQALENKGLYSEFLLSGLKVFLKTGCLPDFAASQRTRCYLSQITEKESSQNECPLTQSLSEFYNLDDLNRL